MLNESKVVTSGLSLRTFSSFLLEREKLDSTLRIYFKSTHFLLFYRVNLLISMYVFVFNKPVQNSHLKVLIYIYTHIGVSV